MNKWTIVVFGASGDLSKRQIIPALYEFAQKNHVLFIGVAHAHVTIESLIDRAKPFIENPQETAIKKLVENSAYMSMDFKNPEDFKKLAKFIEEQEQKHNFPGSRLAYLATAADFFCTISQQLSDTGIIKRDQHHRIVYEKPFGHNRISAQAIDTCIEKLFDQTQIYRIDHYLTKEMVNNIILLRFANILFEPVWNNTYIDHIEVIATETVSIEGRGAFYDAFGAVKDVVQNHILQLIALVTMEDPGSTKIADIRAKKIAILKALKPISGIRGQYENYQHEHNVQPDSVTETFVALKFEIDLPVWRNVPIYVKAGKCLDKKLTEIRIVFKNLKNCLFSKKNSCDPNILTIRISPDGGFLLDVNAKKPNSFTEFMPVTLDFCYECLYAAETPKAYEVLLREIIAGDQSIAVSAEEIDYQWQVVDMIQQLHLPLYSYTCGSRGPLEAEKLFAGEP